MYSNVNMSLWEQPFNFKGDEAQGPDEFFLVPIYMYLYTYKGTNSAVITI